MSYKTKYSLKNRMTFFQNSILLTSYSGNLGNKCRGNIKT